MEFFLRIILFIRFPFSHTELDPSLSSYEITKIYFPDIWSSFDTLYTPLKTPDSTESVTAEEVSAPANEAESLSESETNKEDQIQHENSSQDNSKEANDDLTSINDSQISSEDKVIDIAYLDALPGRIENMKVVDIKNELETLGIPIDTKMKKKDQLAKKLKNSVIEMLGRLKNLGKDKQNNKEPENEVSVEIKSENLEILNKEPEETLKRQLVEENVDEKQSSLKKIKTDIKDENDSELLSLETKTPILPATGSEILAKGHLATVSLHGALNPHRFDQFELVVVAELLRDSLLSHFARYIYTSLVYNYQLHKSGTGQPFNDADNTSKRIIPVNYVHFSFSYFDKNRSGYIGTEDLNNILQNTGFPISRKVITALIDTVVTSGSKDMSKARLYYRDFQQPLSALFERVPLYPTVNLSANPSTSSGNTSVDGHLIIERNHVQYNVDELIKQAEVDQKIKVHLNETVGVLNTKIGTLFFLFEFILNNVFHLTAYLEQTKSELEAKQKKMSTATGRQNDELCAVKRDRDQLKSKVKRFFLKKSFNIYYIFSMSN